jgi:hypothetical protein
VSVGHGGPRGPWRGSVSVVALALAWGMEHKKVQPIRLRLGRESCRFRNDLNRSMGCDQAVTTVAAHPLSHHSDVQ